MKKPPLSSSPAALAARVVWISALAFLPGAAALAQQTSIPATPDPAVAGQASTRTPSGVPNPPQRPDGSAPASRAAVRAEARLNNATPGNSLTPGGEASTTLNGQANTPAPTGVLDRSEVRPRARDLKPQLGHQGERPDVPTNPTHSTGTPK